MPSHAANSWSGPGTTHVRDCKLAIGQLDQQTVPVLAVGAEVSEVILRLAGETARFGAEGAGEADPVESGIGKRQVLFAGGGVSAPFGEPVAGHQSIVSARAQERGHGAQSATAAILSSAHTASPNASKIRRERASVGKSYSGCH